MRAMRGMRAITASACAVIIAAGVGCAQESDDSTDFASDTTAADESGESGESGEAGDSGVETDSGNESNPPPEDINYDTLACTTDDITGAKASGTLTNHSSGLSGYMISVGFLDDAGVRVADATAFVNDVQAGQTVNWEALAFKEVAYARCEVVSVERFGQ